MGEPPNAAGSVSTSGSNSSAKPNTRTISWSARSASTISAVRSNARGEVPRTLMTATPMITAAATRNSANPESTGSTNTAT